MVIGKLDAVRRYPVKSLAGEILDGADITNGGIPGDRSRALFARGEHARAGKTFRGKEDDRLHTIVDVAAASDEARSRGVEVELVDGDHFFDASPISLIFDRWLEFVNDRLGYAVEWERFRPNLFARAAADFAPEERELIGWELSIGTSRLRVIAPIKRCVTITYHPLGERSDPRILSLLARDRAATMGVYCNVVRPGSLRVGDPLVKEAP